MTETSCISVLPIRSMPTQTLTDFTPGQRYELAAPALSKDEIIAFASQFDPQPMHLDEAAGKASVLGGLAASGWHSLSVIQTALQTGLLKNCAYGGLTGIPELRWKKPVFPGVPFAITVEVTDVAQSCDLDGYGTVTLSCIMADAGTGEALTTARLTLRMGLGA